MKWGKRIAIGIVADKPKGKQPPWQHQKSESQKRWEDNHGINPNRPNGTKPGHISRSKLAANIEQAKQAREKSKNAQDEYEKQHIDIKKVNKSKDPYAYQKEQEYLHMTDETYRKLNDQYARDNRRVFELEQQQREMGRSFVDKYFNFTY